MAKDSGHKMNGSRLRGRLSRQESDCSSVSHQSYGTSMKSFDSMSTTSMSSNNSLLSNDSNHSTASDYSNCSNCSSRSNRSDHSGKFVHSYKKPAMPSHSQYIAMDCEMVGTLTGKSACARVVLADWKGRTVMDVYVKPSEVVTDLRTFVSGITEEDLANGESLVAVRVKVQRFLSGKILVGHGLKNDLECLGITHPWYMIRDTAYYEPFMKMHYGTLAPRKLKDLAREKLQKDVQVFGEAHSPLEDAITALELYKCHRPRWEACMQSKVKESQRLVRQQVRQQQMQDHQMMEQPHFYGYPSAATMVPYHG